MASDSKVAVMIQRLHPTPDEQADLSVYGVPRPILPYNVGSGRKPGLSFSSPRNGKKLPPGLASDSRVAHAI
jgi:hypothetical protein